MNVLLLALALRFVVYAMVGPTPTTQELEGMLATIGAAVKEADCLSIRSAVSSAHGLHDALISYAFIEIPSLCPRPMQMAFRKALTGLWYDARQALLPSDTSASVKERVSVKTLLDLAALTDLLGTSSCMAGSIQREAVAMLEAEFSNSWLICRYKQAILRGEGALVRPLSWLPLWDRLTVSLEAVEACRLLQAAKKKGDWKMVQRVHRAVEQAFWTVFPVDFMTEAIGESAFARLGELLALNGQLDDNTIRWLWRRALGVPGPGLVAGKMLYERCQLLPQSAKVPFLYEAVYAGNSEAVDYLDGELYYPLPGELTAAVAELGKGAAGGMGITAADLRNSFPCSRKADSKAP